MQQRFFGRQTGLRVSAFALGTGRIGTNRDGAFEAATARDVLHAFAQAGGTVIDTSSAYLAGRAEEVVGAFLAEAGRDTFVVSTKYGRTSRSAPPAALVGSHRTAMMADIEGSLRRLGTDHIDLYFPHFDDGVTPIEEIMRGLDTLVRAGKVVHLGLSNFPAWRAASAATLAELRGFTPLAALQLEYSLIERSAEREHLPLAASRGLGVLAYSPLGGGRLTARLRAHAEGKADPLSQALVDIATELGTDPMAVAQAWVSAMGLIPVLGARDSGQLSASLAAIDVALSPAQVARLCKMSAPALGQPYDMLQTFRDHVGLDVSTAVPTR